MNTNQRSITVKTKTKTSGTIKRKQRRSYRRASEDAIKRSQVEMLSDVVLSIGMPRAFFAGITKKTHAKLLELLTGMYEAGVVAAGGKVS